ncbi:hypothetical protein HYE42_03180 [Mycoplasmopsis bovis]|nr:hypothetical protein [Mycoplasmopsis bovis]QQH20465.1 hypothetical protein HYE42_03180 [Mycoplasmopsis bovis]
MNHYLNANGKYFSSETIPFGPGTKEALFKYNESLREEYIDKIIAQDMMIVQEHCN